MTGTIAGRSHGTLSKDTPLPNAAAFGMSFDPDSPTMQPQTLRIDAPHLHALDPGIDAIEIVHDRISSQPPHMQDHLWPDGLIDTGMDLIGACLALWLARPGRSPGPATSQGAS